MRTRMLQLAQNQNNLYDVSFYHTIKEKCA